MKKRINNIRFVESDDENIVTKDEVLVVKDTNGAIKGLKQRSATGTMVDLTPSPDKIEDNRTVDVKSVDSSNKVEITPSSGKESMKKVTATIAMDGSLSISIPAGTYAATDTQQVTYTASSNKIGLKGGSKITVNFT